MISVSFPLLKFESSVLEKFSINCPSGFFILIHFANGQMQSGKIEIEVEEVYSRGQMFYGNCIRLAKVGACIICTVNLRSA